MTLTESAPPELRTDALLRITAAIETAATLDELLLLGLSAFSRMLGAPRGGVLLFDDTRTTATLACEFPPHVRSVPPLVVAESPVIQQLLSGRTPIIVRDMQAEDRQGLTALGKLVQDEQIHALLLLPLISQDHVIGALSLGALDAQALFRPADVAMGRVMAGQFAAGIASFRITEAAQRRSRELETLNEIAETVTSSLDPHEVYRLVQQKINEHFNVEAGSLLMINEESGDMEFVMTLEGGEERAAGLRVPRGRGVAWHVANTRRYDIVLDASKDPRIYRKIGDSLGMPTRSLLSAPMVVKGRAIGVIQLLNKRDGIFSDEDGQRLTRMATTIGVAIENAQLFQQISNGRDRLQAILNSTTDGILMVDMHGEVMIANPMAEQIFRRRRDEIVGRPAAALLAELYGHAREQTTPQWFNDPGAPPVVEIDLSSWHPQYRFVRHFTLPVHDVARTPIGQLMLFQDISQERELEEFREDYIGMLVHDLRAPLTAIMNGVLMTKRGLAGPVTEQQNELLAIALQGSQTMLEMINTLLDIAKMEQNRMSLDIEPVSPYMLAESAQTRLQPSAQKSRVRMELAIDGGLPEAPVDASKIERVLQNLLDNAIKFSPSGSTITIGGSACPGGEPCDCVPFQVPALPPGQWLLLWVRDQGPGIPAQYHERIFEKFGQVRGRKLRGTGLGLTFCKLAVEAHGGAIWLESREHHGSTFAFALPLDRSGTPPRFDDANVD
jgi:NtrC-family two-component system sensor histidine kinase KinB